ILSIVYKLGLFVMKLSMDETPSPSKKNCVVISLPLLFIQVLKQPFSMKNIFLETLPSSSNFVLAGTSIWVKSGLNIRHLSLFVSAFFDMIIFFNRPGRLCQFYFWF